MLGPRCDGAVSFSDRRDEEDEVSGWVGEGRGVEGGCLQGRKIIEREIEG